MFPKPMRILTFLAVACLYLAHARQVNIGFQVSIHTAAIEVFPANRGQANFQVARPVLVDYTFIVPLTVFRRMASDDGLAVRLYTRAYDYDEDQPPEEVQVYEEYIFLDGQGSYDLTAAFNLTTNSTANVVNYLRAQVDLADGTRFISTVTGVVVLSFNASSDSWMPMEPAVYAHQENEALHAEYEGEMSRATIAPIDTTLDTIIRGQPPDLPVENGGIVIVDNPPIETGPGDKNTTIPPPDKNTTIPPPDKNTTVPPPDKSPPNCIPAKAWKRNNDGKPSLPPCPVIPPPPCPSGLKHVPIHARQNVGAVTTLQLTLTYGPATSPRPIQQVQVTAFGIINDEVVPALGSTDNDGVVTLLFPSFGGDSGVLVYKLSVSMDTEKYRISTSRDVGQTFLFWRLISVPLTWEIDAGDTGAFTYRFMNKATNDIINVQDRTQNSWVFAKTYVANFASKLPNVWFPGNLTDCYFSNGPTLDRAYINIHPDNANYTSAQAHEYGHWFHFQARKFAGIDYGLIGTEHNFCQAGPPNSPVVSLTEGFATAFGLSSLWQSRFEETSSPGTTGTGFCFVPGDSSQCLDIEQYNCSTIAEPDRNLSTDEGRIAALLRDLIDAGGDSNGGDTGLGRSGFTDASNLPRRRVLYDPMVNNPANMQQYWNNFKLQPSLTTADLDAAWNNFEYQYAQFDRD
ncbi:hypothetical protein NliqN6_4405 [Naganishia liquefaciens]|uniref:Uncharacterized protein n=1 Tax=Naganishia liquefaciens TaxID=104408 RepID=A0A8H3TVR9_9TREE|nr:hypothetical protein NliqN6_4405 [Naganishia liquefaciens]